MLKVIEINNSTCNKYALVTSSGCISAEIIETKTLDDMKRYIKYVFKAAQIVWPE